MSNQGEGSGTPLQYSCLENPMNGGAWWAAVHGVTKSQTRLSDFTFTFHFHALEKAMATHSSVLAWRIPGMGEPGGLPSIGLHWVGHEVALRWLSSSSSMSNRAQVLQPLKPSHSGVCGRQLLSLSHAAVKDPTWCTAKVPSAAVKTWCSQMNKYIALYTSRFGRVKQKECATFLVVPWLRVRLPMQGTQVQSLGPHASRQLNPCPTVRETCAVRLLSPCAPKPANLNRVQTQQQRPSAAKKTNKTQRMNLWK